MTNRSALLALCSIAFPLAVWAEPAKRAAEERSMPGDDPLIGTPAKAWHVKHWINSPPLELAQLRGRVVLIRWWTAPDCPYCSATAPALVEFHQRYAARDISIPVANTSAEGLPIRR